MVIISTRLSTADDRAFVRVPIEQIDNDESKLPKTLQTTNKAENPFFSSSYEGKFNAQHLYISHIPKNVGKILYVSAPLVIIYSLHIGADSTV